MTDEIIQRPKFIIVVELDAAMPRRRADKEHLYVTVSVDTPEKRFTALASGKGPADFAGRHRRLRADLNPLHGRELRSEEASVELKKLKDDLARQGYGLNGFVTKWNCYVVDLEPPHGMAEVGLGYVYVGQTQLTPEERFAVHKGDKPAPPKRDLRSRVVHRRGISLNWDLMASLTPSGPVYTQQDALQLERIWANELDRRGYRVEAGDATPRRASPTTTKSDTLQR